MRQESRGPWYLLTGLIFGVAAGLVFSWLIAPVRYVDTAPSSLRSDFKEQYQALIAVAYLSSGDLQRARVRLDYLNQPDPSNEFVQRAQEAGRPESEIQALTLLISALHGETPVALPTLASSPTPSPLPSLTPSPTPLVVQPGEATSTTEDAGAEGSVNPTPRGTATRTPTPIATRTPTLTPGADFVLLNQELVCDLAAGEAQLQVEVFDAAMQPVPGIAIVVRWVDGEDYFFTGLKLEISPGYADFDMTPGVTYQVQPGSGGQVVPDLTPVECEGDAGRYWGNWRLEFIQP